MKIKKNKKVLKCPHGCKIGSKFGEIKKNRSCESKMRSEIGLLKDYSACDCCDVLMHHNSIGNGYFLMRDGRTLCLICVQTENKHNIDSD